MKSVKIPVFTHAAACAVQRRLIELGTNALPPHLRGAIGSREITLGVTVELALLALQDAVASPKRR